jgi:hypothetical protein
MNDVPKLVTTKPDAERAAEIKVEVIEKLKPVIETLTQAHSEGFQVQFSLAPNSFNQIVLQTLTVSKQF